MIKRIAVTIGVGLSGALIGFMAGWHAQRSAHGHETFTMEQVVGRPDYQALSLKQKSAFLMEHVPEFARADPQKRAELLREVPIPPGATLGESVPQPQANTIRSEDIDWDATRRMGTTPANMTAGSLVYIVGEYTVLVLLLEAGLVVFGMMALVLRWIFRRLRSFN